MIPKSEKIIQEASFYRTSSLLLSVMSKLFEKRSLKRLKPSEEEKPNISQSISIQKFTFYDWFGK